MAEEGATDVDNDESPEDGTDEETIGKELTGCETPVEPNPPAPRALRTQIY